MWVPQLHMSPPTSYLSKHHHHPPNFPKPASWKWPFILLFSLSLASLIYFSSLSWIIAWTQKHTIYLFLKMRVMYVCVSFSHLLFQLVQPLYYLFIPLCQLSLRELFILFFYLQVIFSSSLCNPFYEYMHTHWTLLLKYYEFYFPKINYEFPSYLTHL